METHVAASRAAYTGGGVRHLVSELGAAVIEVCRELKFAGTPPPRGSFFFGLDHDMPYDVSALQLLGTQGIFRKYERVLEVGCGLGGRARWAAEMFGCRVVGIESDPVKARLAALWTRASGASGVTVGCADLGALPVRSGAFTHAWWLVGDSLEIGHEGVMAEVHRVLRDGGYFALVLPFAGEHQGAVWCERLTNAGFQRQDIRRVLAPAAGEIVRLAEARLTEYARTHELAPQMWRQLVGVRAEEPLPVLTIFARRAPVVRT
jgi:SAM-dependent methyltransferase